jgi:hypothetical protein
MIMMAMEDLDCPYGYVLYEMNTSAGGSPPAYVFDHGVLSVNHGNTDAHSFSPKALAATVKSGGHLSILAEHLGKFNCRQEMLTDHEGLRQIIIGGGSEKAAPVTNPTAVVQV